MEKRLLPKMPSEIIRNVSDAGASSGSFLEARSRIHVGEKKVIMPWIFKEEAA